MATTTTLYHHPVCREHDTGPGHPECPPRLDAILEALDVAAFNSLARIEAPAAERPQIQRVHPTDHIERVQRAVPREGLAFIDGDTVVSPRSFEAALRAAGGVCAAVDAVMAGTTRNAFCALRPPGHHAEPNRAMGFCLFNSVATGAAHARATHGLGKVAIVDFDVHHGNGTQAIFERDPSTLYISTHQMPLYPGTGHPDERGVGNILNVALPPHAGSPEIRRAWQDKVEPALRAFAPDFLFISAGFDAHYSDPLASLDLTEDDFAWLTEKLLKVARDCCDHRLVSTLEGGYNLEALGPCCTAHVGALLAV
ncbi:MAG: histone deacetylase family protein [Candidatus Competibacterales bacterium]